MFKVSTKNGFKDLIYIGDDISDNVVFYVLLGPVLKSPTRTSIQIDKDKHVEDRWGQFINHNCNPNTKIKNGKLVSIKPIKHGDSITFDYNLNEDRMKSPFVCNCCGNLISGKLFDYTT